MAFLSGFTNVTLISQCSNLEGLTVTFTVTEDLVTVGDTGFGLQLNCFPQANQVFQNQTLNWFQYGMVIGSAAGYEPNNDQNIGWFVEYWDTNAQNLLLAAGLHAQPAQHQPGPAGHPQRHHLHDVRTGPEQPHPGRLDPRDRADHR